VSDQDARVSAEQILTFRPVKEENDAKSESECCSSNYLTDKNSNNIEI
jgi:hypothetical protein